MKLLKLLPLHLLTATLAFAAAETERFPARYQETTRHEARVFLSADFTTANQAQWNVRGNAGVPGNGRVVHAFARFKLGDRDLLAKIATANQITINTGLVQKEKNRVVDAINGGHDVDVYLALHPDGQFVPHGEMPSVEKTFDWVNELCWGYANTVYLGRVLQSHPRPSLDGQLWACPLALSHGCFVGGCRGLAALGRGEQNLLLHCLRSAPDAPFEHLC